MSAQAAVGRRVLLVEDSPGDAELIVDQLETLPNPALQVEHVVNLQQASAHLQQRPFDIVLLDLNLPDGSGLHCVQVIRNEAAAVPIVVLTGLDDDALALQCITAGAQDYLTKHALHAQTLGRAISHALARAQAAAEERRADELQARLAAIVDSSYDAIVSSTTGGTVTSWNRGAERIFGFSALEAVGRPVREVIPPEPENDGPAHERRGFQPRRGADAGGVEELVRFHKDGRPLTLSVVTSVVRDTSNAVLGLAAILRDITESKRRDAELAKLAAAQSARERRVAALMSRLRNVQEEERTRMSREVHDGLGQLLTGLKMDIDWLSRKIASGVDPQQLRARLHEAEALVDQTVETVQRLALELRPSALDSLGLAPAIRDEARRFEARSGVGTAVDLQSTSLRDPAASTALFRIVQELLSNVARHARATSVRIELFEQEAAWVLHVADNGVGLPLDINSSSVSLGILGMVERAESIGGTFTLERGRDGGTVGTVVVPRPTQVTAP